MSERRIRRDIRNTTIFGILASLVGLTGCTETQLAAHVVKSVASATGEGGDYKVGQPYKVNGSTYFPQVDPTYNETGMASWYGAEFHGKSTANGDTYNMNALTAAHTTLPMPSQVRVTNLENGRSLVLTVNDRGPFVKNRIIDVSRRAAQLLGFERHGTAKVRVEAVSKQDPANIESAATSQTGGPHAAPKFPFGGATQPTGPDPVAGVSIQAMAPPPGVTIAGKTVPRGQALLAANTVTATPAAAVIPAAPPLPAMFVQGGAFRDHANAVDLQRQFTQFGPTVINPITVDGKTFYRVRLGPVYNADYAERLLTQVVDAGHQRARLVVD